MSGQNDTTAGWDSLFDLTVEQRRAFRRMKRAHEDCLKLGIRFYNNYGNLGAIDARKFKRDFYNDKIGHGAILDLGQNQNELKLECWEWCDDRHWFHPAQGEGGKETHERTYKPHTCEEGDTGYCVHCHRWMVCDEDTGNPVPEPNAGSERPCGRKEDVCSHG